MRRMRYNKERKNDSPPSTSSCGQVVDIQETKKGDSPLNVNLVESQRLYFF